jgi:hypothetical protein
LLMEAWLSRFCQYCWLIFFYKIYEFGNVWLFLHSHIITHNLLFVLWFFIFKSEMRLKCVILNWKQIIKEITELSFDFSRQGVVSIWHNLEPYLIHLRRRTLVAIMAS